MRRLASLLAFTFVACDASAQQRVSTDTLPACEGCGAAEAPAGLTSAMTITPLEEPGERLTIRGTVYRPDGRRPAAGVLLYAYHTNAEGEYAKRGTERGNALRHGYLRGWLLTDAQGRYTIHTIRPGAYPSRRTPAHIHVTLTPPGGREQWAEAIHFHDDPLVAAAREEHASASLLRAERQADGTLAAALDLVLDASGQREIGDFTLPGSSSASPRLPMTLADARPDSVSVDLARSVLRWRGSKFWGRSHHEGTVHLAEGVIVRCGMRICAGRVTVDMTTVQVTDIPEDQAEPRQRLTNHLASRDFFWSDRYPRAVFDLRDVQATGETRYRVTGMLTIRDVTRPLEFTAEGSGNLASVAHVASLPERITARFRIDRQNWGIEYRFDPIRNELIDDEVDFDLTLVLREPLEAARR